MLWTSDAVFECCWNGKHADHELAAVLKDSCFHAHAHPENKGSRLEPYWLYPIIMSAPDPQNVFQVAGHLAFESGWFSGGLMLYRLAPRTQLSSLLRFLIESKQMSLVVELISDALGIVCPLRSASTSSSSSSSPNAIHGLADQSSSPVSSFSWSRPLWAFEQHTPPKVIDQVSQFASAVAQYPIAEFACCIRHQQAPLKSFTTSRCP